MPGVKLSGAEFRAFLDDLDYWGKWLIEEEIVFVNGEHKEDFDPATLKPDDVVAVTYGELYHDGSRAEGTMDYVAFIRRWLRARDRRQVLVEIRKERIDMLRAAIEPLGGKLLT